MRFLVTNERQMPATMVVTGFDSVEDATKRSSPKGGYRDHADGDVEGDDPLSRKVGPDRECPCAIASG